MLSLIGSLVWIAIWIYYGVVVATIDDESGPTLSIVYFVPACVVAPIVGKYKFFSDFDYAKDIEKYLTFSFVSDLKRAVRLRHNLHKYAVRE